MSGTPYGIDGVRFRTISQPIATSVSILTTITSVLVANEGRNWVHLRNLSATSMWLGFSSTSTGACAIGKGIRLDKLGGVRDDFEINIGLNRNLISRIWAVAGTTGSKLNIVYYNEG